MSRAPLNLGIACAAFLVILGAYAFWYAAVRDLSAQTASLAAQVGEKQADAARAASARRALSSIRGDEAALAAHFVAPGGIVDYLGELERAGASYGAAVSVGSVSAEQGGGHPHLALTLAVKGSFESVLRTLGAIEYGPVDVRVSNLTLTEVPGGEGQASSWTAAATMAVAMQATSTKPSAKPAAATSTGDSSL
jgi:hypothetical protein